MADEYNSYQQPQADPYGQPQADPYAQQAYQPQADQFGQQPQTDPFGQQPYAQPQTDPFGQPVQQQASQGAPYSQQQGFQGDPYAQQGYQQPQGYPQQGYPQQGGFPQQGYPQQGQVGAKSKMVAGLLAIFLGSLGIHKFYMGWTKEAVIMLLVSLLTCGIGACVMAVIGIIEGIMYLTKDDMTFYQMYEVGGKTWF